VPNKTRISGKQKNKQSPRRHKRRVHLLPNPAARTAAISTRPPRKYERILKWAEYAAIEELIEGHPRGNLSNYCNFCFQLGENYLRQYILKKKGYK